MSTPTNTIITGAHELRGLTVGQWTPAEKWLPPDPEPVLAYDMGTHYIASWNGHEWIDCSTEEPIDCFITHWRWLDTPEDE